MGLKEICEIVKELEKCSSTKGKKYILSKYKDDDIFKKILYYTYNTNLQYGIKQRTIDKMNFNNKDEKDKWNTNVWKMLEELAESNINSTLTYEVEKLLCYFDEEARELLIKILLKDLRCNISVKTINSAIPGLIHQHQVMLASKFEGKLKGKVSMSLKMDGIRNSALIENGDIKHISRQGKLVVGLEEINKALKEFDLDGYFIDGEIIRKNIDDIPSDDNFRLTTKIVNSKSFYKEGLEFVIFDIVPIEDYYKGESKIPYEDRLQLMEKLIGEGNEFIRLVPKYGITDDIEEIYEKLHDVTSNGDEGLMLNTLNGVYAFGKRPKDILKVKKFEDGDVLVTDVLEGEGRLKGKLGKIEVQFKYEDNIYTNYIGSGFSDDEREYFWNNKEELIGKIITIKYFELSKNEKGGIGFRFGTWKGKEYIREDKDGIDDTNV